MITRSEMTRIIQDKKGLLSEEDMARYLAQVCPMCYDTYRELTEEEAIHYYPRPDIRWNKISLMNIIVRYSDWHDATLDDVRKEFLIWFESETREPEEINNKYLLNRLTDWGEIPLEEIKEEHKEDTKPIGDEKWFYFQCGTSLHRGQLIPEGLGYVLGERVVWINGNFHWKGLQVSQRGNYCCSEFVRLHQYSHNQSIKGISSPAIVCGKIQKKYVFDENNKGEYFIPKEYFSKIEDFEILELNKFKEKYL